MFEFLKRLFRRKPKEIKIGLALGSGGAKGYAHLGALKAFEENGISFDYVAGTSIGSIIGAFYANGFSSDEMINILNGINLSEFKTTFMINMDTKGVSNIIEKTMGSISIEDLKKPFVAIATEMDTGAETTFKKGSVARALCASSSYPPFFKSVEIDGKRYIDGAFTNSVPADKIKEMGADYVIGIDLATHEKKKGLLASLIPSYQGGVSEPWRKGYENSDYMLHPDLKYYLPVSFKEGESMYKIGYKCAMEEMPKILADIDNLRKNGFKKPHFKKKFNS